MKPLFIVGSVPKMEAKNNFGRLTTGFILCWTVETSFLCL